jgi:hypothetical protein
MSKQSDPQQPWQWQLQQGSGWVDSPLGVEVHGFDEEGFVGGLQRFDRDGGFADGFGSGGGGGRDGGRAGQNIEGEGEDKMVVGGMMGSQASRSTASSWLEQQGSSRVGRDMQQAAYREQQLRQQGELELRQERGQAKGRGKQAKERARNGTSEWEGGQAGAGKGRQGAGKGRQQHQQQQQQQRRRRRRRRTGSSEPTKHRGSRGSGLQVKQFRAGCDERGWAASGARGYIKQVYAVVEANGFQQPA